MNEQELTLQEICILAYAKNPKATVKEFRQNVMEVARTNKATSEDARRLLVTMPHLSNDVVTQVLAKSAMGYQQTRELLETMRTKGGEQ